jgi:prefoldin subunit 5
MINTIEVKESINNLISCFSQINRGFDTINKQMGLINSQLKDDQWKGESKTKCQQVHDAIRVYYSEIRTLCESLQNNIEQLKKDANNFCSNSSSIRSIKSIK